MHILAKFGLYGGLIFGLCACGGGGGSSPSSSSSPPTVTSSSGKVLLGPVINADIALYEYSSLDTSPIYTTTTLDNDDFSLAGNFDIPNDIYEADTLYLLVSSGGDDIDFDDNGERDTTPTSVGGDLHMLITGSQIADEQWKVNLLTELAYQQVKGLLITGATQESIVEQLDIIAAQLISEDINDDGLINSNDIQAFNPVLDLSRIALSDAQYQSSLNAVHLGSDIFSESQKSLTTNFQEITLPIYSNVLDIYRDDEALFLATTDRSQGSPTENEAHLYRFDISGVGPFDSPSPTNVEQPVKLIDDALIESVNFGGILNPDLTIPVDILADGFSTFVTSLSRPLKLVQHSGDGTFSASEIPAGADLFLAKNSGIVSGIGFSVSSTGLTLNNYLPNDSFDPDIIGSLNLSVSDLGAEVIFPEFIVSVEQYLYIGTSNFNDAPGRLIIVDNTDPSSPVLNGHIELEASTLLAFVRYGSRGYIATYSEIHSGKIYQVDLANISEPILVDEIISLSYRVSDLAIYNDKLLINGDSVIAVADVENPLASKIVKHIPAPKKTNNAGLISYGDQLYTSSQSSLMVIDNIKIEQPYFVDSYEFTDKPHTIAIDELGLSWLLFDRVNRLAAIDTNDPESFLLSTDSNLSSLDINRFKDIEVRQGRAFILSDQNDFYVVDLTSGDNLPITSELMYDGSTGAGFGDFLTLGTNLAAVIINDSVVLIDITDPDNIEEITVLELDYSINDIVIEGELLYVLAGGSEPVIEIYDMGIALSAEVQPLLLGEYALLSGQVSSSDLEVKDSILYLVDDQNGMQIINASNPMSIVPAASFDMEMATKILIDDVYAYVANKKNQITIIDVSDLLQPVLLAVMNTRGEVLDIVAQADHLIVADSLGVVSLPKAKVVDLP